MAFYSQAAPAFTNLPAPTTRLIGRRVEMDALNRLLGDYETRMITLLAPGGMGKTALMLEVAYQQLQRFADGIYLITVSGPISAEHLATMIADVLNYHFYPGGSAQQQILGFIRPREVLLLVDNAEYLGEAALFLSAILQAAPSVKILATSQLRLNLYAETLFPLAGLSYAEDTDTNIGVSASEANGAVELFVQRSKNARPDFQLTPETQAAVLEICRMTQGMPLALVLAASWMALLTPEEIVREIRRGIDFLESDLRDVPERQRSIRRIFDYTWGLMTTVERRVLVRLSVFRRGFTREAAQAVAQGDLPSLMSLLRKAVLQPSSRAGRYDIHELLRLYAAEQLQRSGDSDAVVAAQGRYFLGFVGQQASDIKGRRQLEALNAIQADEDNIRAAWEWAIRQDEIAALAAALEGLFWYCMMRSRYPLFEMSHQMLQDRFSRQRNTDSSGDSDPAVRLLLARAQLRRWWMRRWRTGSMVGYPEALDALEALAAVFREFDATQEVALCTLLLGDAVRTLTEDPERALALLQGAYQAFAALGDDYYAAWALHFVAKAVSETQGIDQGVDHLNRALALRRKHGDQIGAAYSLYNLSTDLLLLGRLEECAQVTQSILSISRETGEQSSLLMAQITLNLLSFLAGRFDPVRHQNTLNHRLASNLNHELGLAWTNLIDCLFEYFEGNTASAIQYLAASEGIGTHALIRYFVHLVYALLGYHDPETIRRHLLSALRYAQAVSATGGLVWCLPPWAAWEAQHGEPEQAAALLALAQAQPPKLMGWLPVWLAQTGLQTRLEQQLGSERFAAASAHGQALDLGAVVQSLLSASTFQEDVNATIPAHIQEMNQQLIEPLSDRELEVLRYIGRGLSNREIADELVVELSTVKKHLTHIYGKLDVGSRAQAILRAQHLHLI